MIKKLVALLVVARLVWGIFGPALKFMEAGNYDHFFIFLLEAHKMGNRKWNLVILLWKVETTHEWTGILLVCLASEELCLVSKKLAQGHCLGFIEIEFLSGSGNQTLQSLLFQLIVEEMCCCDPSKDPTYGGDVLPTVSESCAGNPSASAFVEEVGPGEVCLAAA